MTEQTQLAEMRQRLNYCQQSGNFTWKQGPRAGSIAGSTTKHGYVLIRFTLTTGKKLQIYAHRLAWVFVFGRWPKNQIDHINRTRNDNCISNLREVTACENAWNTEAKGYYKHKTSGLFHAIIMSQGKKFSLGYHKTECLARNAYLAAKDLHHGK